MNHFEKNISWFKKYIYILYFTQRPNFFGIELVLSVDLFILAYSWNSTACHTKD